MIITDLLQANAGMLIAELRSKMIAAKSVSESSTPGGDYRQSVDAYIEILSAAVDAAEKKYEEFK